MRAGVMDWIGNLVVLVCLGLILLNIFFLLYEDAFIKTGKGKIVDRVEHPGRVPGLSFTVEFVDPETGKAHRQSWNPIAVHERGVGDEVPIAYPRLKPEEFSSGDNATYRLWNTLKVYAVMSLFILFALGGRIFLANR